jgi:hypothetical protein
MIIADDKPNPEGFLLAATSERHQYKARVNSGRLDSRPWLGSRA